MRLNNKTNRKKVRIGVYGLIILLLGIGAYFFFSNYFSREFVLGDSVLKNLEVLQKKPDISNSLNIVKETIVSRINSHRDSLGNNRAENPDDNHNNQQPLERPPAAAPAEPERINHEHDEIVQQLSFLQSPIPGATVSTRNSHLPGAPRPYRNGIHEGLDYYSGFVGVPVNFGDPVYAAGGGSIYRIDHVYSEPTTAQRNELLRQSAAAGYTSEVILDKLRGRQVWINHGSGIVTRYAHLHEVSLHFQVGDRVEAGALIGTVGNSGTDSGAIGNRDGPHLHFEIWVGSSYLGKGMKPDMVRSILQKIL